MDEKVSPNDVKVANVDEKRIDQSPSPSPSDGWVAPNDWLVRLVEEYRYDEPDPISL